MAINTALILGALKTVADEEKRTYVIMTIVVLIAIIFFIILLPLFLILYPLKTLGLFFSGNEYNDVVDLQSDYPYILETGTENYSGRFPMPINGVITSDYGMRIHPITKIPSKHTGIDISGIHRDNVIAICDGFVTIAEIQKGYGNCIEIKHEIITYDTVTDEDGNTTVVESTEIFYSFYAHLSRIDVVEGMQVRQGEVIGIEGGDPKKDPNAGTSTGHHLHFEIRTSSGKNDVDPKEYIM